ncbi:hypothetical protein [Phycicoccus sonneratiae]|uniref:Uncharacterized protein n=1 Tax=Phycicoccus sonneratiae TaxID=2807628 RepID=A0ABS2CR07_9MICO|nr:hypothetical protein [Phycicoccus sonneraticus]MBM6402319.1 hypothetical protein [Phycicoccus sonneraticus]
MSNTVMTAAFGSSRRFSGLPGFVTVFAEYVVGGSGVMVFHDLDSGRRVRICPGEVTEPVALMAGFALISGIELGDAADLATRLQASGSDVELSAEDAEVLQAVVSGYEVSLVVTFLSGAANLASADFADTSWTVRVAVAADYPDPSFATVG